MKIEVKPLPIPKWHGKTGKESFTRPKTLNVLIDPVKMQYATGLNYTDKTFEDPDNPKVKLTEAEYYERILKVDLSPQYIENRFHSFWDSKTPKIKLENRTMYFNTENPIDYIKIKIMKASKFVANSLKEWEEGHYPYATHVITDEQEEVEIKASKLAIKKKAILEGDKLPDERKAQIIMILAGINVRGKSSNFIEIEFDKLIEKDPQRVLDHIGMNKEDIATHALILEAIQKNVLRKSGHKIMYMQDVIGNTEEDVIAYLNKEENQDLKLRLIAALN